MLRLLTLAWRHSAARLLILLLLPCPDGWWPGGRREAGFTELSKRPLVCPFVDCADPCEECYQQAAENTHLPVSFPATSLLRFPVVIKEGYGTSTTVNAVLCEGSYILCCVSGSMM